MKTGSFSNPFPGGKLFKREQSGSTYPGTGRRGFPGERTRPACGLRRLGEDFPSLTFDNSELRQDASGDMVPASRRNRQAGGRRSPGNHSTAAFTMIEIALCLAIIGFALVAIIGVLPIGMSVQKDNREGTVINFDANYLMDVIRSGARGQDSLTNYVVAISNYWAEFTVNNSTSPPTTNFSGNQDVYWYLNYTNGAGDYYYSGGSPSIYPIFYNGANVVGLLSTPKYVYKGSAPNGYTFRSNYISADFRAITGSSLDQGTSQTSKDFAFVYRVFPEINPAAVADPGLLNDPSGMALSRATNLQANLSDLRLSFRWPVLPGSQLGPSFRVFRTVVSGGIASVNSGPVPLTFITPLTYNPATSANLLP